MLSPSSGLSWTDEEGVNLSRVEQACAPTRLSGMRPGLVWLRAGIVETSTVVFALGDPLVQIQITLPPRLLDVFHLPGLSMSCFLPRPSALMMGSFGSEGGNASPFSCVLHWHLQGTAGHLPQAAAGAHLGLQHLVAADINCECSSSIRPKPRK
jgi:hypothetical protein